MRENQAESTGYGGLERDGRGRITLGGTSILPSSMPSEVGGLAPARADPGVEGGVGHHVIDPTPQFGIRSGYDALRMRGMMWAPISRIMSRLSSMV